MWIDSHCHLDDERLKPEIADVVARAHAAGVQTLVSISTRMATVPALIDLVQPFPNVFCTIGTHPLQVSEPTECDVKLEAIIAATQNFKVVGIGESGLDYFYDASTKVLQKRQFIAHIEAARHTQLPLVIHARSADEDMIEILTHETKKGPFPALLHCYSSGQKLADCGKELGCYFSLSGIATFPKSGALRDIILTMPRDRILIETDAPYLAPSPHRGKLNEPAFVIHTGTYLAEFMGEMPQDFARHTTDNFLRLFTKVV